MKPETYRILIADDTPALHESYYNIFTSEADEGVAMSGMAKFAPELVEHEKPVAPIYALTHVQQGEEAITAATLAQLAGTPFALAILDVRMPPGIDGVQTARRLQTQYPDLQIVLCTAYTDYTWSDLLKSFPGSDSVLLLKKPFDAIEIRQIATALCRKWKLAEENRQLILDLENRVASRTQQLSQTATELTTALQAAEAGNRAKNDFLRCISHELNSPLNGVHGAASVLELSDDVSTRKMGQIILESSARLNRLFRRILLYIQLEAPAVRTLYPLQVIKLLEKVVEPQRATASAKGLTLQASFSTPPELHIFGRAELLETALENLMENAVKFTARGSISVHLKHLVERKLLQVEITDTGEGCAPAKIDELASLFSPGDTSLQRKQSGIGLGLALVGRIARHLNGEIQVKADSPGGSVFTLTVPCATAA
jgi:two-component system, sensor histidine kinase and response regulator